MSTFSKKILILVNSVSNTQTKYIIKQIDLFEQLGYSVRAVNLDSADDAKASSYFKIESLPTSNSFANLFKWLMLLIISPMKSFACIGTCIKICKQFKLAPVCLYSFSFVSLLMEHYILKEKFSHIYTHCEERAMCCAYLLSKLSGVPYSLSLISGEFSHKSLPVFQKIYNSSNLILTSSEYERRKLYSILSSKSEHDAIIICPLDGINIANFPFAPKQISPKAPYKFVSIIEDPKLDGLNFILKTAKQLQNEGLDFTLTILTDLSSETLRKNCLFDLSESSKIFIKNGLGHSGTITELNKADLFLLAPPVAPKNGIQSIPISMKIAMAVGIPVVATNNIAIQDLIENYETGMLSSLYTPKSLAEACKAVLHDSALAAQLQLQARLRVEKVYDLSSQLETFMLFLNNYEIIK